MIPQLLTSIRKKEHKMQVGRNQKHFEFCYIGKAAEAHLLAMHALLDPATAGDVAGEAFFISDGRPEPFFDFARRCYAAAGSPVAPNEITIFPLAAMQAMASAGEWAYRIFTLGSKMPALRRDGMDYLDRGACWSLEKAKQRLGYEPIADQDAAIKRTMEWALANL
jgi:sterol-4alpha-carboxylate 3-dehydrogenase (decarboxylating)